MPVHPVMQRSHTGCFIACVAMMTGRTYNQAFSLLRPGVDPNATYSHGWLEMSMEETIHSLLRGLGIQSRTSKYRKFRTFRERVSKHAIMLIRWRWSPTMCHCVFFDGEQRRFIDPSGAHVPHERVLRDLQDQLECAIIIDHIPQRFQTMTFIEVLQLIEERGERIVTDKTHAIRTDKFLYAREPNGEWMQRELPPVEPEKFPPLDSK